MDCYLRRNLALNGGILNEVYFIAHTNDETDLNWITNLIDSDPDLVHQYRIMFENKTANKWDFPPLWKEYMSDPETIYVKIDDDVVSTRPGKLEDERGGQQADRFQLYIHDDAIPRMVNAVLDHPEAHSIQANVINAKRAHWYHYKAGAVHPFLPDPDPITSSSSSNNSIQDQPSKRDASSELTDWRISTLPTYPLDKLSDDKDSNKAFSTNTDHISPNHRWLPLPPTPSSLALTPIATIPGPDDNGILDISWGVAAQVHYSFFQNLENSTLSVYHFGSQPDKTWNLQYAHWNINFMAIKGGNVGLVPFWQWQDRFGDEVALTEVVPKMKRMPVLVDTGAVVSHYSFHDQVRELSERTDVLERYRLLANERVCGVGNQKVPFEGVQ